MEKLIALDVDGTLLNSRGNVPASAVEAVERARSMGVRVVLATGRSAPEAVWLTDAAGCDCRAVVLGGGAVIDAATGRHLRRWDMADGLGARVLELLEGQPLYSMVFAGEVNLLDPASEIYFRKNYPYDCYFDNTTVADDLPAYLRAHRLPLTKVYATGEASCFPPLLERLGCLPGLTLTSSGADNFEVLAQGTDKGRALCLLAAEWGIAPEDIAAVGDSDNDLAMLRAVGWPVAMGNASAEVKRAARMVTDSNDRDGVARAIDRLLREWEGSV